MDFSIIGELCNSGQYKEAEQKLLEIIESGTLSEENIGFSYFLLGYIHSTRDNKNRKETLGKKYFLSSINCKSPDPRAYVYYANIEKDKNVAISYLRIGLGKFPKEPTIFQGLLKLLSNSEKLQTIKDIDNLEIGDYNLLIDIISYLVSNNGWDTVNRFIKRIKDSNDLTPEAERYFSLIKAYAYIFTKKNSDIKEAFKLFKSLTEEDVDNDLRYSHYLGAIYTSMILEDYSTSNYYFDKLPVNNSISDLNDGPDCIVILEFDSIYKSIFNEISEVYVKDVERRAKTKCLYSLYLYKPFELSDTIRYKRSDVTNIERYYSKHPSNDLGVAIFNMKCGLKMYYSAYETFINLIQNYIDVGNYDLSFSNVIRYVSDTEFQKILDDIINKLKSGFEMDYSVFTKEVFDELVIFLFEKKQYPRIVLLANAIPEYYLNKSNCTFECAYSFNNQKQTYKAENLYSLLIKNKPKSGAAYNNLGVILENKGDLINALVYYKTAMELDSEEELYKRNYKRVNDEIISYSAALESIKKEKIWFIGRLSLLYEKANEDGIISCTYNQRPSMLAVRPEKANELIDKMCREGYIIKVSNGNSQSASRYEINPLVKEFINSYQDKLKANKEYEEISDYLNIDTIEEIGYNNELLNHLSNINDDDFKTLIQRDIKECAITLLTRQFKASIVLCGSITEAILVNHLKNKGIEKYDVGQLISGKSNQKKIVMMDLNELLEVAMAEKAIKHEEYHLSSFLRHYRNIIHPAREIRSCYEVNKDNAELMWKILLKVVKEIL